MSRAQQDQVNATSAAENSSYNTNATDAFHKAQGDVGDYASAVGAFKAGNPYGQGGVVQTADNQQIADTAAGQAEAAGQAVQGAAVRTGQNAGGAIAATEQMQEANERALVGQEAGATKDRASAGTGYGEAVLAGTAQTQQMQDTLAQQQAAAAQGALGTQEQSAQQPSFMDELGTGLIQAGVGAAAAYCPAKGSRLLMADGVRKLVDDLKVGELIAELGGGIQTILNIEHIRVPVLRLSVQSDTGWHELRNSYSHSFAGPYGGFIVAEESLGKRVLLASGSGPRPGSNIGVVTAVQPDGEDLVYNIITDGTHTYCADGVWAVGDALARKAVA